MSNGVSFYSGNEDATTIPSYSTQPGDANTSGGPVEFYKGESDNPRSFDGTYKSWDSVGMPEKGNQLVSPTDKY